MAIKDVFYDKEDAEFLSYRDKDEAIYNILNSSAFPLEKEIDICKYKRCSLDKGTIPCEADSVLNYLLERLDESFGSPDDSFDATPKMGEAARKFVESVFNEYVPWTCEVDSKETINVATWVEKNEPDWMKLEDFSVES